MIPTIILEAAKILELLTKMSNGREVEKAKLVLGDGAMLEILDSQRLAVDRFRLLLRRVGGEVPRNYSVVVEVGEAALLLVCGNVLGSRRCSRRVPHLFLPEQTRTFVCNSCLALDPRLTMRAIKAAHPDLTWDDPCLERAKKRLLRARTPRGFANAATRYASLLEAMDTEAAFSTIPPLLRKPDEVPMKKFDPFKTSALTDI